MGNVATLIFAALLIEAVVNIVQNIQEKETSWKYWASLVLGVAVSVLVAFNWDVDLFAVAGMPAGKFALVGPVLTGLILSRGSNVVSDLVSLINTPKALG
jgi:uncharacterized membrane protein